MKRHVTQIEPQYFEGDAPGAARVVVTVGNQRIELPRLTILGILTLAANHIYDKLETPPKGYKLIERAPLSEEGRQYYKALLTSIQTLRGRLESGAQYTRGNPVAGFIDWWTR